MSVQVGRLQPVDRPGLATWILDDIAARDALTSVDGGGEIPITEADVGRIARVGTESPYQYFELVAVDPMEWAEFGAPGADGADGADGANGNDGADGADAAFTEDAPADGKQYARKDGEWSEVEASGGGAAAPERFHVSMYIPDTESVSNGEVLAQYVMPSFEGAVTVPSDGGLSVYAETDESDAGTLGLYINNQNAVAMGAAPITGDKQTPLPVKLYPGDLVQVRYAGDSPSNQGGLADITVTLQGELDRNAPAIGSGFPKSVTLPANLQTFTPFVPADDSGIALVLAEQPEGVSGQSGVGFVGIYDAVDDGNGGLIPNALIGSAPVDLAQSPFAPGSIAAMFASPVAANSNQVYFASAVLDAQTQWKGGAKQSPTVARSDATLIDPYAVADDADQSARLLFTVATSDQSGNGGGPTVQTFDLTPDNAGFENGMTGWGLDESEFDVTSDAYEGSSALVTIGSTKGFRFIERYIDMPQELLDLQGTHDLQLEASMYSKHQSGYEHSITAYAGDYDPIAASASSTATSYAQVTATGAANELFDNELMVLEILSDSAGASDPMTIDSIKVIVTATPK